MSQQRQFQIVGGGGGGIGGSGGGVGGGSGSGDGSNVRQYHDTTYTKLFVGGLAWETQRDTMRSYFEQFGEILEAVVITDKNTGKSKGYGFVTFKDPEAAFRACQNPSPMIDGRRANCNLAAFGAQKAKPPPIQQVVAGPGRLRPAAPSAGLVAQPPAYPGPSSTYFHQPSTQLAFPYSAYGYSGYSHDTLYPMNYYNALYGGQQFSPYYIEGATAAGAPAAAAAGYYHNYYPYYNPYAQSSNQAHGLQYQYHPQLYLQPHHFTTSSLAGILSLPTTPSPLPLASTAAAATTPAAITITTGATTTTVVAGPVIPGTVSGPSKVTGVASEQSSSTT